MAPVGNLRESIPVLVLATLTLLLLLAASTAAQGAPAKMTRVKTVVIDPGHGGENDGALSVDGTHEKHITLAIALRVEAILTAKSDATVHLTRRDDRFVGLRERTRFANEVGADVFLSIHCNSEPGHGARGIETFLLSPDASDEEAARLVAFENLRMAAEVAADAATKEDQEVSTLLKDLELASAQSDSEPLAALVLERLVSRTGGHSRGVKQAPFAVLKEAEMPAIVIEVGFLSNPSESQELQTDQRQEQIAQAIVEAILRFDREAEYR